MNEQLQKEVFEWVKSTATTVQNWVGAEVPPFIHEYLTWKFYENLLYAAGDILGTLTLVVLAALVIKFTFIMYSKFVVADNTPGVDEVPALLGTVLSSIFALVLVITSLTAVFGGDHLKYPLECIQIKVAPKVYLMEKAANIIGATDKK